MRRLEAKPARLGPSWRGRAAVRALSIALPALIGMAGGLPGADDFYQARLKEGEQAYRQRRPVEAAESLRIAAFGLLDRPAPLVEALAQLALAQDAAGQTAESRATLDRFLEVQRRFAPYREARLEPPVRAEFEALLRRRLPAEALRSLTATRPTPVPSPAVARTAAAPPSRPSVTPPPTVRAASPAPIRSTPTVFLPAAPAPVTPLPSPFARKTAPAVGRGSGPAALVVPPEEVDRLPQLRATVRPVYPAEALRARAGGIVLLRVLVSETGAPVEIEVMRAIRQDLAAAAVAAVRRWSFEPALRGSRRVRTWTTVAVPFEPSRP